MAGAHESFAPRLCAGPAGELLAVWHDARNGKAHDVYANYSADRGGTWLTEPVRLDDGPQGGNSLFPRCAFDGATAHVAWTDEREGAAGVYHRALVGGVPGPETRVDADSLAATDVQIAVDEGEVFVAWIDGDELRYATAAGGAFAGEDHRLDAGSAGVEKHDLATGAAEGVGYAVWTDAREGTTGVWFRAVPLAP